MGHVLTVQVKEKTVALYSIYTQECRLIDGLILRIAFDFRCPLIEIFAFLFIFPQKSFYGLSVSTKCLVTNL